MFDGFGVLTGVFGEDFVELIFGFEDALGVDLDVRCLSLHATQDLVNHHFRIWEGEAFAFGATRKENRSHRCGHADADG